MSRAKDLTLADPAAAKELWALSPYQIVWSEADTQVVLDYITDPWIADDTPRPFQITVHNRAAGPRTLTATLAGLPNGWAVEGLPAAPVTLQGDQRLTWQCSIIAPQAAPGDHPMRLDIAGVQIPFTLVGKDVGVGSNDLALASRGSVATADGEYAKEVPCVAKAIDGIIPPLDKFEKQRWHSSIATPHPHWIQVKLPKPETIGSVVIRFADPKGYAVSFQGNVQVNGEDKTVLDVTNNKEARVYRAKIAPVTTDTFRLVIRASANPAYPNAAQIGEIELYPAR
jgi:hypothetical protein